MPSDAARAAGVMLAEMNSAVFSAPDESVNTLSRYMKAPRKRDGPVGPAVVPHSGGVRSGRGARAALPSPALPTSTVAHRASGKAPIRRAFQRDRRPAL